MSKRTREDGYGKWPDKRRQIEEDFSSSPVSSTSSQQDRSVSSISDLLRMQATQQQQQQQDPLPPLASNNDNGGQQKPHPSIRQRHAIPPSQSVVAHPISSDDDEKESVDSGNTPHVARIASSEGNNRNINSKQKAQDEEQQVKFQPSLHSYSHRHLPSSLRTLLESASSTIGDVNNSDKNSPSSDSLREESKGLSSSPSATTTSYSVGVENNTNSATPIIPDWTNSILFADTKNVVLMDKSFMVASIGTVLCWFLLLGIVYYGTPSENFVYLDDYEKYVALFAGAFIFGSMITKLVPIMNREYSKSSSSSFGGGALQASITPLISSGILMGCIVVQVIASFTDIMLAVLPTPVIVDHVTGARTYPWRYCEWTVLAFLMTFLTEGANIPQQKDEQEEKDDCIEGKRQEETSSSKYVLNDVLKLVKLPFLLGTSQGLSTLCGLIFPYTTTLTQWIVSMTISVVLFLFMYVRLYYKRKDFVNTPKGTSLDDNEIYDRIRLSYKLLETCTVVWTLLVFSYFVGAFSHWFTPSTVDIGLEDDNSNNNFSTVTTILLLLKHPSLAFTCDCVIDVIAKAIYMGIIIDIYNSIFDDRERSLRRLDELRRLMSVVWECSSDVIGISIKGGTSGSRLTTMLSPTFHKFGINNDMGATADGNKHNDPKKSSPIIFEMTVKSSKNERNGGMRQFSPFPPSFSLASTAYWVDSRDEGINMSMNNSLTINSMENLLIKAWSDEGTESLYLHDIVGSENSRAIQCEVKATRLGPNALVIVMRDISERFMCFEAEKKAVSESTARKKDAEANRFTRHEVKNGLLASIGLCDTLRESLNDHQPSCNEQHLEQQPNNNEQAHAVTLHRHRSTAAAAFSSSENRMSSLSLDHNAAIFKYISDLDVTLHELLDTVLAETMARDVIHEVYEPKIERVDVVAVLSSVWSKDLAKRFPVVTTPSPFPVILFDPQLLKYIYRNALSNACKYGKKGGIVVTEVCFVNEKKNEMVINFINFPGDNHNSLVKLGRQANEAVFSPGKRLHSNEIDLFGTTKKESKLSSGDGAWISRKCARTLGGDCTIRFEEEKTIFSLRCPAKPYEMVSKLFPGLVGDPTNFCLPNDTVGVGIDDSKLQRKLMSRYFTAVGIPESQQVLLGEANEIRNFTTIVKDLLSNNPTSYFLVIADENLDFVDDSNQYHTISGSLCIQKLLQELEPARERRMLALVRSANDSASDIAMYNSRSHGFLCKAPIKREKIMEFLAPLWAKRFARKCRHRLEDSKSASINNGTVKRNPSSSSLNSVENLSVAAAVGNRIGDTDVNAAADLMTSLEIIDALSAVEKNDLSSLSLRWPALRDKLQSLKTDLKRMEEVHGDYIPPIMAEIDRLDCPVWPDNFQVKWSSIRSRIIRII